MTIYQCVTLEGWTDVLYMTSRVEGIAAGFYFVSLVVFGSFYVLNLFLAVMFDEFINAKADDKALEEAMRRAGAPGSKAAKEKQQPNSREDEPSPSGAALTGEEQMRLRLVTPGASRSDDPAHAGAGGAHSPDSARTDHSSLTSARTDYTSATTTTSASCARRSAAGSRSSRRSSGSSRVGTTTSPTPSSARPTALAPSPSTSAAACSAPPSSGGEGRD